MDMHRILGVAVLLLVAGATSPASMEAQVVEGREAEANPASVLFRSTLYGAGTGAALGGAYLLIADDPDAGDVMSWSVAGGAAAGLLIGALYAVTRSEPEDGEAALMRFGSAGWRVSVGELVPIGWGRGPGAADLPLVRLTF